MTSPECNAQVCLSADSTRPPEPAQFVSLRHDRPCMKCAGVFELTRLVNLSQLDLRHSDTTDSSKVSVAAAAVRSLANMNHLGSLCLRSVDSLTPFADLLAPLTGLTLLDLSECCHIDGRCGLLTVSFLWCICGMWPCAAMPKSIAKSAQ